MDHVPLTKTSIRYQPTGVGFSYGGSDHNKDDVGLKSIFITDESFGGHYVPAAAHYIVNHANESDISINLKGIASGNGMTDPVTQIPYTADMARNNAYINLAPGDEFESLKLLQLLVGSHVLGTILERIPVNVYDIRKNCSGKCVACKDAFNKAPVKPLLVNGKKSGEVQATEILCFVQVYNAGHMVPENQPEKVLELINRFFSNKPLDV
ncbi:hypothetical protein THRCLA_06571 [Thraustotheca clavata]|uniref:Serine protease family S33 n=1 Tax=Thraustotheca clavata TaxID=74557 RepID=A0A1V9ZMN7_9STRA|nr:hypothetical protein THRCLA_06571 [Thraustotheca clavata]